MNHPIYLDSREPSRILRRALICAALLAIGFSALLAGLARPALGAEKRPMLRASVVVASDLVTIGDFFEDAGALSDTPIFRAPDLGTSGKVPATRVLAEARAAGLRVATDNAIVEVTVTRPGREIAGTDLQRLVAAAAARQLGVADPREVQIAFDQPVEPRIADDVAAEPARVVSVTVMPGTGRFDALVMIDRGGNGERLRLRGVATEVVEVLTLTRPVGRGEIIRQEDVAVERIPRRGAGSVRPLGAEEVVGLAARRTLRAGQPLTISDFSQPLLVRRGETVTLVYEAPGLVLTVRGQALEQGSKGDSVTVLNQQSKRTIVGTIAGPGRVVINRTVAGPLASLGRAQP